MKKYYLLVISVLFNITLSYADVELRKKVSTASADYLSDHFMNGAYMFCDADGVIDKGAKGLYSTSTKQELQPLQQMPIASATKTMTAAGILKLQDKNLLDVQSTLAKYLDAKSGIWKDNKVPEWAKQVCCTLTSVQMITQRGLWHPKNVTPPTVGMTLATNDSTGFACSAAIPIVPPNEWCCLWRKYSALEWNMRCVK